MGEYKIFLRETNWVYGGEIKEETNWVYGGEIKEETNWVRKESCEKNIEDKEVELRVSYERI